jgi:hypothetical protein
MRTNVSMENRSRLAMDYTYSTDPSPTETRSVYYDLHGGRLCSTQNASCEALYRRFFELQE